jgi:hypothetical protein
MAKIKQTSANGSGSALCNRPGRTSHDGQDRTASDWPSAAGMQRLWLQSSGFRAAFQGDAQPPFRKLTEYQPEIDAIKSDYTP